MFILYPIVLLIIIGAGYLAWRRYIRAAYATWPLFYQMLAKWMVITIICGGYSFFLGLMVSGMRFIPMMAAMVVTAAALAFVESRGRMGDIKARFPLLKRAMRYGTRFRIFWAFMIGVAYLSGAMGHNVKTWYATAIIFPTMTDVWIGLGVTELFKIIGFNIQQLTGSVAPALGQVVPSTDPEWINQLGVFGISLTTAAIHVMILAVITLLIWAGLSVFYRATGRHCRT